MAKKNDKVKMEEELKSMQKHMGGLVRTIVDLKSRFESVEKQLEEAKKDDFQILVEKQRAVDEAIAANLAAISEIDKEIKVLSKETTSSEGRYIEGRVRKCRYYDRGHCKYKRGCKYFHPRDICSDYLQKGQCEIKNCMDRHPKVCKFWSKSKGGCKRDTSCDFIHVTLAQNEENREYAGEIVKQEFKCIGDSVRTFDCENCDFKSESYNIYFEHINVAHEYGDDFDVK